MAFTVEQKVGLFFLSAIIVLGLMIELVEDWRPFEEQHDYRAYFNSSVGLRVSDPVRIAGVQMGKVRRISIEEGRVRVDFFINQADSVRVDTVARIRQTNMLGGVFLGLDFGSPDAPLLPEGGEVNTEEGANIDELITNINRNQDRVLRPLGDMIGETQEPLVDAINRLESVMTRIDQGEGTLGLLVNNPELYEEMTLMAKRVTSVLGKMEKGEGSLGRLMQDDSLYNNLNQTMVNLSELTSQVKAGEGTLGKLLRDDQLYLETTETIKSLRVIAENVSEGKGTLGKFYADDTLYDELTDTVVRVNSIASKIDDGQGTIGRLVNEDDLYREAKTTLHKVEKSVDGLSDAGPLSALGVVLGTLF